MASITALPIELDQQPNTYCLAPAMLNHQINFSQACEELYKPISGRPSDPDSIKNEGNVAGIAACERYRAIVLDLQQSLSPELEMIETRIIQPANDLLEIIKQVRKTTVKRSHKKLDWDRHRTTLKKLEEKKDKTLKDEKAMMKAQQDVDLATEEFEYYNGLLMDELPKLFRLERDLIRPLFESFYYMQLNVFYMMYDKMQHLHEVKYFDLGVDIEAGFKAKQGDVQQEVESLGIVHFKTTGGVRRNAATMKGKMAKSQPSRVNGDEGEGLPAYTETPVGGARTVEVGPSVWSDAAAKKKKPAPPPPKKPKPLIATATAAASPKIETATALYDFVAQTPADLSFEAGDVIEIVRRSGKEDDWWTGKLRGKQGTFPGNYVALG